MLLKTSRARQSHHHHQVINKVTTVRRRGLQPQDLKEDLLMLPLLDPLAGLLVAPHQGLHPQAQQVQGPMERLSRSTGLAFSPRR